LCAQIEEMQSLETAYAACGATFETRKKDLTAALRAVERLNVELRVAEGYAAEARRAGLDGTRDMTVELMCQG
jgi:thiamine monophosphate synthase